MSLEEIVFSEGRVPSSNLIEILENIWGNASMYQPLWEGTDDFSVFYEFLSSINDLGADEVLDSFSGKEMDRELIFSQPSYSEEQDKFDSFIDEITRERVIEGLFKCGNKTCENPTNTVLKSFQFRAGDEGVTNIVFCNTCGKKTYIN